MLTSNAVWTTSSNLSNSIETPTSCNHVECWISPMWKFIVLPSHYINKSMNGLLPPLKNGGLPPSMNGGLPPLMNGRRPPSLDVWLVSSLSTNGWCPPSLDEQLASSLSWWMAGILPPSMNGPVLPLADGLPSLDEQLPPLLRQTASSFLQHMASSFSWLTASSLPRLILPLMNGLPPPSTNCPLLPSTNCLPLPLPCLDGQYHPLTNTLLLCVR